MRRLSKLFASILIVLTLTLSPSRARADLFGGDVAVLIQILIQAIDQVYKLQAILGKAAETVRLLEEMNRGVKEVLKLAETAHLPLPKQVYEQAKQIDQATLEARRIYGAVTDRSPVFQRSNFRSGVEGLFLSQDAMEYSSFLDKQGDRVKASAIVASQASATRLSAQTLGVLLHAVSHGNRLNAKQLELLSTSKMEDSAKQSRQFESFIDTYHSIESEMKRPSFMPLNTLGDTP